MASVAKSSLDSAINLPSTVSWDDIPTEIILYIFKKLDIKSIRCCFSVNRKWKEIAMNICEAQDLWQEVAEDGIVNHGVSHRSKSNLSWKDLYFNSLLWKNLQSASINKMNEMETKDVRNMFIYRDKMIVTSKSSVAYYDIETFEKIRGYDIPHCEDVQEADNILMVVTHGIYFFKVTVFLKLDKDEQVDISEEAMSTSTDGITQTFEECWRWRIVENCAYIIDKLAVLWECRSQNKSLSTKTLGKYYRTYSRPSYILNTIHVIKKDVYVTVIWGDLFVVWKRMMMFDKVTAEKIPTKVFKGYYNPHTPVYDYKENVDKFDALIKVPFAFGDCKGLLASSNMLHFHYDDPDMTSSLQHGDVVFRGFEDGRVEITLLRDGSTLKLRVAEFDGFENIVEEPAVVALEVFEVKDMHKLFIATRNRLYTVMLSYPEALLET